MQKFLYLETTMAQLRVKGFSCIDEGVLELRSLVVLIGPQAAGKSVVAKLVHFFQECIIKLGGMEFPPTFKEISLEQYAESILADFKSRFPAPAWGLSAFEIEFTAGPLKIRIFRAKPRKKSFGHLKVELSELFQDIYLDVQSSLKAARSKSSKRGGDDPTLPDWSVYFKIHQTIRSKLRKILGDDFVTAQLFIPAGRSFFTSMGKAVTAFEHAGLLDPLTVSFGKYFLIRREALAGRTAIFRQPRKQARDRVAAEEARSEELFSGKITFIENEEYIDTADGRRVPFSAMSSGQQELLPLWLAINEFFDGDAPNYFAYIEEPEAHLFPSAQKVLTEYLIFLLSTSPGQKMIVTTHSPYILSAVNNLLKAGSLGARRTNRPAQGRVEEIIPRQSWLVPGSTSAYAIRDRRIVSILDESSVIDGDYLDEVSSELSRDFNRLLEIEYVK